MINKWKPARFWWYYRIGAVSATAILVFGNMWRGELVNPQDAPLLVGLARLVLGVGRYEKNRVPLYWMAGHNYDGEGPADTEEYKPMLDRKDTKTNCDRCGKRGKWQTELCKACRIENRIIYGYLHKPLKKNRRRQR